MKSWKREWQTHRSPSDMRLTIAALLLLLGVILVQLAAM